MQDASLHASVSIPAEATATGHRLVIYVSNFGDLAVVTVDNAGAWNQREFEVLLSRSDHERIYNALDDLGYTVIPEELLWTEYQGRAPLGSHDARYGPSWWTRFFDYL